MFATHMLMKRSSQNSKTRAFCHRFGFLRQLHAKQSRDQLLHLARLHLNLGQNQSLHSLPPICNANSQ